MLMQAIVIEVQWGRLLVLDLNTRQNVLVNTSDARWFSPGDMVRIWYNGAMTNSIPPQISALSITAVPQNPLPPVVRPPCPPNVCRPPVVFPPIFFPPVVHPPFGRPPSGRPPHNRPGRPR
ncbi:hypothetical protein [Lawsonibacter celer]|jgi:hypothetical protein|uniref:hypothetical protein n=1 Tax=Lawsonibacter celer TaxID=2986526 RepID=UPI0016492DCC|nr:hypothetical protein [Lawsonibacter celer]